VASACRADAIIIIIIVIVDICQQIEQCCQLLSSNNSHSLIFTARRHMQSALLARCSKQAYIRLSVCLSVRPSVTRWYCDKITQSIVLSCSLHRRTAHDSSFFMVKFTANFQRERAERGRRMKGCRNNLQFSANKSPYPRNGAI